MGGFSCVRRVLKSGGKTLQDEANAGSASAKSQKRCSNGFLDQLKDLSQIAAFEPVENKNEAGLYRHRTFEDNLASMHNASRQETL